MSESPQIEPRPLMPLDLSDSDTFLLPRAQTRLEELYPDNPGAVAINLLLWTGHGADDALRANLRGSLETDLLDCTLQSSYIEILQQLEKAGRDKASGMQGNPTPFHLLNDMLMAGSVQLQEMGQEGWNDKLRRVNFIKDVIYFRNIGGGGTEESIGREDFQLVRAVENIYIRIATSRWFIAFNRPQMQAREHIDIEHIPTEMAYVWTDHRRWGRYVTECELAYELSLEAFRMRPGPDTQAAWEATESARTEAYEFEAWAENQHSWLEELLATPTRNIA